MTSRHGAGSANHDQPRANPPPAAVVVDEGFDDVTTLEGAGWFIQNNSNPLGIFTWGQGNPVSNLGPFDAFDGDPAAYVSANYQSTDDAGTINNWLVTPTIAFGTGSSVSFYTRTVDDPTFPDRLEVRLCTADPCTNVGSTETDTGDFGTLLLSINPNLQPGDDPTGQNGYPASWTQFTIASGLPTSGNGRIAFRYFVTDGGPSGDNSDFIGIDRVVIDNGTSGGGGDNGIILSGPLNHAVQDSVAGTSLNMTTSAFDDTGPVSGDWDFNFYDIGGFSFYTIDTYATQYVVDNTGHVVVLHVGDVVGSSSLFSNNADTGNVPSAPEWAAGTDGYAGVRFNCDGRLPNPVSGGVCYGFVHITTTGSTGFPASIIDTGFDGDGNAITITGGGGGGDPSATVTPTSLDFTVAADTTATQTLNIANAAGSDSLTYSIETRSSRPSLIPHVGKAKNRGNERNADIGKLEQLDRLRHRLAPQLTGHSAPAQNAPAPWAPVGVDGTPIVFEVDDGTYENVIGLNNGASGGNESFGAVWVNRFTATGPLTIDSISIEWPSTSGIVVGMQPNLLVYYDASSSGDVSQAVRLGTDTIVTIGSLDTFETYTTSFSVPGTGDVYIGFDDAWALVDGGFEGLVSPGALDDSSSPGAAYISGQSAAGVLTDLDNLANNDLTGSAAGFGFPGNWMVRATATGGGSGGACTGPIVNWLSANPTNGTVAGGSNTNVSIKADPAAGGLAAGDYTGEVCITTNDPAHPLIAVPVSLTVTAVVPAACAGGADEIFCDGFDPAQSSTVVSGTINQPVAQNADGSSFDFALDDYHAYDASITTDDINLYALSPGGLYVYWYGDAVPPEADGLTGGVVDSGGVEFAVLHSGDKIGPSSMLSAGSIAMTDWQVGADGYIGVAFWNESTSAVNYGYIHMTTQSPEGFPAQVLNWAYDNSGAAITIP